MAHESKIQRQIVSYLKRKGYWPVKMSLTSENGWPDLLVIGYNHIFFIEAKSPGKEPRPLQIFIHEKIREFGHDVLVADSVQTVRDYLVPINKKS